ncbi:MAG: type I 3-dehydroquinate dehydratase, partial [Candidatus Woesearchaeota archaeon]|nr:type I 3-dehydroquinate dehydratase [Candidatus Woesearchaeota archaeon]
MKTRICVPVTADTVDQAIVDLKQAEKFTDLVELRIDFIKNIDIGKLEILLKNKTKEVIVTCRPKSLNGNFIGNEKERINLLKKSIELNAEFVDIESDSDNGLIGDIIQNKKNTKIIVSYHNFKETPKLEQLANIYNDIKKLNPDLIKIVTFAGSINDNFEIFKLLKDKNDLISFCMGLRGEISRILAPKYGSCITFASLNEEKVSAPGQIDINEMDNVYNFSLINEETMVIGLIGEHAEHSKSKSIMNPSFKDLKLNFVYLTFKLTTDELPAFMKNFRQFEFAGASVTIPHKLKIIKMIDEIDE